ncbi:MAG: tetratricopeptide repeat protein [Aestuariivirga sp.]
MKFKSLSIFAGFALWILSSQVTAGELENGIVAIKAGKLREAVQILEPLAKAGNREAQYQLGGVFETEGEGQDYARALKWYRLASERGNLNAEFRIAAMHSLGRGVPIDRAEAIRLYKLCADLGNVRCQQSLAFAYAAGNGVPKDDVLSYMWSIIALESYTIAGDQGGIHLQKYMMEQWSSRLTFSQKFRAVALANKWKQSRPKKKASLTVKMIV